MTTALYRITSKEVYNISPTDDMFFEESTKYNIVATNVTLPDGAEKSAGLRKLLEAKDCFVRAALG